MEEEMSEMQYEHQYYKAMLESWLEQATSADPKFTLKTYGLCFFAGEFEDKLLRDPSVLIDAHNSPRRILQERLVETFGQRIGASEHPFNVDWDGYVEASENRAQHLNEARRAWVRKELEELA